AYFQHVAGLGLIDVDRAGEDMRARALGAAHLLVDVDGVLEHLARGNAGAAEICHRIVGRVDAAVGDGVDLDGLARLDAQGRRDVGGEIAPHHRVGRRAQRGVGRAAGRDALGSGGPAKPQRRTRDQPSRQYVGHVDAPHTRKPTGTIAGRWQDLPSRAMIALIAMQSHAMFGAAFGSKPMASLTIRRLDDGLKKRLRLRAASNGRSMEDEARIILGEATVAEDGRGLGASVRGPPAPRGPFKPEQPVAATAVDRTANGNNVLPVKILLIIGGGIAAYKSLDLIRRLK